MRKLFCFIFLVTALCAFVYPQVKIGQGIKIGPGIKIKAVGVTTPTPTPTPWPCSDFSDDFSAGSLNGAIWTEGRTEGGFSASVTTTTGGQLTITVPSNPSGPIFGGALTQSAHNITGGYFMVKLVQVPDNAVTTYDTSASVGIDANNWVRLAHEQGQLYWQKRVSGGSITTGGNVEYDGSSPIWLLIRESGGMTFWETSTDGLSFTIRDSQTNPFAMTSVFYNVNSGANAAATHASASAIFDDVCAE